MAIFTDKVVSATFMDYPQNTIVDVIYKEGDQNISYVLEVDFTQDDFKSLLQEITLDEIESNTKASIEVERNIYISAVNAEIERRWALESEKVKKAYADVEKYTVEEKEKVTKELQSKFNNTSDTNKFTYNQLTASDVLSLLSEKNEDKDFIFNMKIAILEYEEISKSKDKTLKTNIRKGRSVLEILSHISDIMKK